jgi:polyphosphate kinase
MIKQLLFCFINVVAHAQMIVVRRRKKWLVAAQSRIGTGSFKHSATCRGHDTLKAISNDACESIIGVCIEDAFYSFVEVL